MPSRSEKQRRFMNIAAHDEEFAKKNHIDPKVAKEFHDADKKKEKQHMNSNSKNKNK